MATDDQALKIEIPQGLAKLVPGFLSNRQVDLQQATDALGDEDWDTLAMIGHRLYGTAGSYGFDGLADIGRDVEQAASGRDSQHMMNCLDSWQHYLEQVRVVYVKVSE